MQQTLYSLATPLLEAFGFFALLRDEQLSHHRLNA
jgi:hypothetical protein